jgi:hypothetical protein
VDEHDDFGESATETVFRDVIFLTLVGFVAMVIMLLPHIKKKAVEEAKEHKSPGQVIVEMQWPPNMPYDVDLWVKAPGESPVGFWNQGGLIFNLLRDDLGDEGDVTMQNFEVSYSRGIPAGEYVVNVHMYGPLPKGVVVPVSVTVSTRQEFGHTRQILTSTVKLDHRNQEETAFKFRLTSEGELIKSSVSTLRHPLITGAVR